MDEDNPDFYPVASVSQRAMITGIPHHLWLDVVAGIESKASRTPDTHSTLGASKAAHCFKDKNTVLDYTHV